ncbi:FAD-binding protein [Tropicimonas sp. IMCC34043]|uniref:FAD-binding protein n=1 Tax=Tropicimonas sp. IMCC34043 TaxID=2248760 RepID=UPI000E25991D|nr:FAD-binding protein [Tropicimonas sp. IMCC34043]
MAPGSEAELAEAIAGAAGPLAVRGGGTRGRVAAGEDLSVAGISGVVLYEPEALTLVARAGTPMAEIEALLDAEGQRLAFEPMDHRMLLGTEGVPTIGGVVAGNVSGPRRIQAGACRDALLGLRFVDGMGQVLKSGGRVMKNVTGYDLVRLLAGSRGTLGVLSEVSLKVLPRPEAAASLRIQGLSDVEAVAALAAALGSPFEVTGAAHSPRGTEGTPETLIRVEGFAESVAYRSERLCALLADRGEIAVETEPGRVAAIWSGLRDVAAFAGRPGDVWRVSVRPSDGPRVGAAVQGAEVIYDWGGGLVWVLAEAGSDLRAALAGISGHASLVRAAPDTAARLRAVPPEPAPVAALSAGLRARFDPRGILNPGLMDG